MILQKYKKKISILWNTLKFIYGRYTIQAILRDIFFAIGTAVDLFSITVLGKFIDETAKILLEWKSFNLVEYFGTNSFLYLAILLALWIVSQICLMSKEYFYYYIYEKVWEDTRYMMMSKVSRSNLQDVEQEKFQDLLTYVPSFSIDRIATAYSDFSVIMSNVVKVVGAFVIVFGTMGWYTLLILLFVIPETIAVHIQRRKIKEQGDRDVASFKILNYIQNVSLHIPNFSELRVNDTFSYLKRKYTKEYDSYIENNLDQQAGFYKAKTVFSSIGQFIKYTYIIFVLAVSIVKRFTIGTFKALYDYVEVVYTSTFYIVDTLSLLSNKLDYIEEFFKLIEYEGYGDQTHGDVKLPKGTPAIEIKNLTFAYPDKPEKKALKGVYFSVEPGQKVAIFGGDGSGKSTMVRVLTGLYQIVHGEYKFGGYPVKELDRGELKKKMAVTFQNFINYNFSLKDNVVISGKKKKVDIELYGKVSKAADIPEIIKKEKIDDAHILGKLFPHGQDLSPGYWQRLAISRMLYRNKDVFIMDEPFTFVDTISAKDILNNVIDFVGKDRSLIYITRSIDNLDMFDKIYYMADGRVVEEGTWNQLMKKKGNLYKETCSKTS
ncbi:MAG: ABC transporter ATP-binding protein [Candidatus Dojkabacteria bacterium]|nr:ABC transporter ATP-binding protein [Candidatus Dojkabacteria bacterium]